MLESSTMTLSLQDDGGDQALDPGSLECRLLALLLCRDFATNDILANIIILARLKSLRILLARLGPRRRGTVTSVSPGRGCSPFFTMATDRTARSDPTMQPRTDLRRLSPRATGTIARVSLGQEQTDAMIDEDTLLHGEALLVIATSDLEDISLEFVPKGISLDFLGDALVIENAQLLFIRNLDEFLATSRWVGNVKLKYGMLEI